MALESMQDYLRTRIALFLATTRDFQEINGWMIRRSQDERLLAALRRHDEQLREEVANLEQIEEKVGSIPDYQGNPISQGAMAGHKRFFDWQPVQEIADMYNAQAAFGLTSMLVGAYQGLVELATQYGDHEVVEKLRWNQANEQRFHGMLEELTKPLITNMSGKLRRAA